MVNGVVAKVFENNWQDKKLYGFSIEGDDRLFGTGLRKVDVLAPGVNIEFEAENVKGRWKVDPKTVVIKSVAKSPSAPAVKTQTKEEYWEKKDLVIELQSCRNSAIALAEIIINKEAIKLPTKKEDQYQAIVDLVAHLTASFVTDNDKLRNPDKYKEDEEPAITDNAEDPDEETW